MIFQEPMTSLNPLHTIERQVGEISSCTAAWTTRRRGARASSNC
jgi:microcin C transport system ATP-binding protein